MKLLVTGGAGYIGSHMVKLLLERGHRVMVVDDLSSGRRDAVQGGTFIRGDCGDRDLLDQVFAQSRIDGVLHFAGSIQVGESVVAPRKYYYNNVVKTMRLLDAMLEHDVGKFVFSSSAAVYGEPVRMPIDEAHPKAPINAYGASKWMIESVLHHYHRAYGLDSIALRYFNAAGAAPDGTLGPNHQSETHLLPLAMHAASGRRREIEVYGRDYPTPDGTCIRDYVHVSDLCLAHLLAMQRLGDESCHAAYNLGSGDGFSVQQVLSTVRRITGVDFRIRDKPRRDGDPARLVADTSKVRTELGWKPQFPELENIVRHAWRWEQRQVREPVALAM